MGLGLGLGEGPVSGQQRLQLALVLAQLALEVLQVLRHAKGGEGGVGYSESKYSSKCCVAR